jgi:Uma2 family endonuclease
VLEDYFESRGLGEVFAAPLDTILAPYDVVQPDLLVVTDPQSVSGRAIEGPPAVAIEILSRSTAATDRTRKARRYAAAGVRHYWLVDPERRRFECLRLETSGYVSVVRADDAATLSHPDWPGFTVSLEALWG